ncbi:putative retrotransposon ty1-copia subclass protein [Tanacetum coccineum]|uniref:Retrotransposon ty1-copia subclass protein n=1 Tax=Tanacetum coccineum TaxID=301880 RepID=A0ABQ5C9W4_9ASTR
MLPSSGRIHHKGTDLLLWICGCVVQLFGDNTLNFKVDAINVEMQSIKDNQVWRLVDLSPNCKIVGSKCIFRKKTDIDGNVHTYKARLVAKGFTQTYGVDYEETFLAIADIRAIRILIAIAAFYDYEISQNLANSYVFILNGGAVDWKSSKQSTTAMSATETEYIVALKAGMEAVWIRKFISGLGIKGARHHHRRYHYVRECIELGEIKLLKVHTDDNLVDPFTKALSKGKLTQHARSMGLR